VYKRQQTPEVTALINANLSGMRGALAEIKKDRDALRTTLATSGLDNDAKVKQLTEQLDHSERRGRFMESLPAGVTDKGLAHLAAIKADLVNPDGSAKLDELKSLHPGLFTTSVPPGNAGAGSDNPPKSTKMGINEAIKTLVGID